MMLAAVSITILTQASGSSGNQLDLRVLLIGGAGGAASDPTTGAWAATLQNEGVPYTEVDASGFYGSETLALPTLNSDTTGLFDAVVLADAPEAFASGQLSTLFSYESSFGVRQADGYGFPTSSVGLTYDASDPGGGAAISSTTLTLTAAGLTTFPSLKGPVPFDSGTYGYPATVASGLPAGASETPLLNDASGDVLMGLYQHPSATQAPSDPQAGVSELTIGFDYNANQLQWLILGPALIDWVTQGTHLGLYRNYLGQDVDDVFIADNEWSSLYQCTPAATNPIDYTCPPGVAGNPADTPPDVQMTAADVAYVTSWEQANNFKLEMAFNAVGACTAPSVAAESHANCTGSTTVNANTYTDPGQNTTDPTAPNDGALVDALLANQGSFDWINHTWSHAFLGCITYMPQATSGISAGAGGSLPGGTYSYEVTAATAYGESEPSVPLSVTVGAAGSVTLTWPDATNGTGAAGNGPTLATLQAQFGGGTGFWGYNLYRSTTGAAGTFGLVGQVPENGAQAAYSWTDLGAAAGGGPSSSDTNPTATDPGIDCASAAGSWFPVTSGTPQTSVDQEVGLNDAFAANNGLTNFTPTAIVTGEHSGLESPNIGAAWADMGITTFGADGSRQPTPYRITGTDGALSTVANSAPRYPSNIYYNAATWADQINEYNTLYASTTTPIPGGAGNETGHCAGNTSTSTCISTAATEASILASESRIELGHVLDNNPRVGFAHQSNLVGPDYTLLTFLSDVLGQYNSWYSATTPSVQTTDVTQSNILAEQAAWATALASGSVTASSSGGQVTVTNNGATPVAVPISVPTGSTVNGTAFGSPYGAGLSGWQTLAGGASLTISLAPGSLHGTVVDADTSQPVANICVYLYAVAGSGASYATCSGSDGTYTVSGVAPGQYDVAFSDPSGLFDTQWFSGRASQAAEDAAGQSVTVAVGQTVSGINAAMYATASVAGRVTDAVSGQPLSGICIYAYSAVSFAADVGATCTGASGAYRLGGLPAGGYDLAFVDPTGTHPTAWYQGVVPTSLSGSVTVTNTGPAPEANEVLPGFTGIAGTVTATSTSQPIGNICVYLYAVGGSGASYATCTASGGTYALYDVAPGSYDVAFSDPAGAYLTQWSSGAASQALATPVTITANAVTGGVNASMAAVGP